MPTNVNKKLRNVDRRLSQIDRGLGFLQTRVYFQPIGGTWEEVDIINAIDRGTTPSNLRTGEQVTAHRFSVQVNRDWLDDHFDVAGSWSIAPDGNPDNKLLCELEAQSTKDSDTFGSIDLRVAQPIAVELPPPPPIIIPPPLQ